MREVREVRFVVVDAAEVVDWVGAESSPDACTGFACAVELEGVLRNGWTEWPVSVNPHRSISEEQHKYETVDVLKVEEQSGFRS